MRVSHLRVMGLLKFTNMASDFYPYSGRINGNILEYVPIDATKKVDKKTSHVVNFIIPISLRYKAVHKKPDILNRHLLMK